GCPIASDMSTTWSTRGGTAICGSSVERSTVSSFAYEAPRSGKSHPGASGVSATIPAFAPISVVMPARSEEHTSELQSRVDLVSRDSHPCPTRRPSDLGLPNRFGYVDHLVDAGRDRDLRLERGKIDGQFIRVRGAAVREEPPRRLGGIRDDPRLCTHLGGHAG